ncbi:MAG: hypothetical protein ACJ76I_06515 [Gaiellaceae bacterium]
MPEEESCSQLSRGTNHLLRLGATPVTCVGDVLAAIGVEPAPPREAVRLEPRLEAIRSVVSDAPATADEVVQSTGVTAAEVAAALAELELLGAVVQEDGLYRGVMPPT